MNRTPDFSLLRRFGNEGVYAEKLAGGGALAARIAVGLMEANRSLDNRRREEHLAEQAERMNAAFREMEAAKMFQLRERMRHSRMPLILMAMRPQGGGGMPGLGLPLQGSPRFLTGEDVPLGMDEGMVRMASAIGQDLALYSLEKDAGIGAVLGNLGKSFGGAAKGLKSGIGALGQGLSSAGKGLGSALQGAKNFTVGKLQSAQQMGSSFLAGAKNKLQGALPTPRAGAKNPFLSPPPNAHNPFRSPGVAAEALSLIHI